MTMPKKARKIRVNDKTYLWMVRVKGDRLSLTVQDPKTKELHQKKLDAYSPELDDYGDKTLRQSVTPAQVVEFILTRFP